MKLLAAALLALVVLANAQLEADEAILRYLNPGEDYSTIEVVYQFPGGQEQTNVLVVVRGAPVFIVSGQGELVEDEETVLSVSRDYVESRAPGVVVASAESIAASIIEETRRRKGKTIIRETSNAAVAQVASARQVVEAARESMMLGTDFGIVEQELGYYEAQARDIGRASTLDEARVLNHSFYTEYAGISRFASSLNQSFSFLAQTVENTRQARELLNSRKVEVGRDDSSVLANEGELQEIEALLAEETGKIQSVAELNPEAARQLSQRSEALVRGIRGISGGGLDLVSLALGTVAILIIIGGVVLHFKKLRKKQEKEEQGEHPPEQGLVENV
ncbi:hypothetical protein HY571_00525 [Candidatus Micrarchaeota archaeon]|nr:hypothetical protein [Candidatus Micrarchaeota archaeon]